MSAAPAPAGRRARLLRAEEFRPAVLSRSPIVRAAVSLFGSTVVTSVLGFLFWLVAARMLSAREVGLASAVQAATQLIGTLCMFGLGTLLISEFSQARDRARPLLLTSLAFAAGGTGIVAVLAVVALESRIRVFSIELGSWQGRTVFVTLAALTAVSLILDDACVGLGRPRLQFRRNAVFSVSKLVVLPPAIWYARVASGMELVVAWLAGTALSVALTLRAVHRASAGRWRMQLGLLLQKRRLMASHHWLNVSVQVPRLVIPVMVASVISPQANAAYFSATLLVSFVNIIPTHLCTALFSLRPGDEPALRAEARRTMAISLAVSAGAAPVFLFLGAPLLRIFNPAYTTAAGAMAFLSFTTLPAAVKAHYVAISRVRGRMVRSARLTTAGALLEIGGASLGGVLFSTTGVGAGYLAAYVLEALCFLPTVGGCLRPGPRSGDHHVRPVGP